MILSENRLRQAAMQAWNQGKYEYYRFSTMRFDAAQTYDLFISHSFKDKDLVIGLYHLFSAAGYKVYIDLVDDSNLERKCVTPSTAEIIRKRIEKSKGASYIATANSMTSKWCPWELGVADGMHNRVCILPIMNATRFEGQEYLGLYPYLEYEQMPGQVKTDFYIHDQQDPRKYVYLGGWLLGLKPFLHKP